MRGARRTWSCENDGADEVGNATAGGCGRYYTMWVTNVQGVSCTGEQDRIPVLQVMRL